MEKLKGSTALMVLGIALLAFGAVYPFVTLVVDTAPPTFVSTVPAAGQVYASLTSASAHVTDDVSGVKQVRFYLYNYQTASYIYNAVVMSLTSGNSMDGTWTYTFPTALTTPGKYAAEFIAQDNAANVKDTGWMNFTIYTQLQGNWYINDQQITSTSQTVYSSSTSITFKFVKTAGIDDSYITVIVSGSSSVRSFNYNVDHVSAGTWQSTWTLEAGTWTITLKAYDGTTTITYSVVGLTIPGAFIWVMTTQQALILAGMLSIVAGVVLRIKKK
jgi:hypothetical protein